MRYTVPYIGDIWIGNRHRTLSITCYGAMLSCGMRRRKRSIRSLLLESATALDETVIALLFGRKELKKRFFLKIKDAYIFRADDFRLFMEEHTVDNSYTAYKNRIGLTDGKRFLSDSRDVVLDFPYKDCVLEGGQSTEEGKDAYFEYEARTKNQTG